MIGTRLIQFIWCDGVIIYNITADFDANQILINTPSN